MLVVHQLARVLLDVDALDADGLGRAFGVLVVEHDLDRALAHQRVVELADLVALRQIGVEVVLAVEPAPLVDLRVDRHAGAHRLTDALAVRHRQHARHRRIDQRHLRIRLRAECRGRAGEQLGVRRDLCVDFEADHDLPVTGCALDAVCAHQTTVSSFSSGGVAGYFRRPVAAVPVTPCARPRSFRLSGPAR